MNELKIKEDELFSGLPEEILSSLSPAKMQVITLYLTGNYTKKRIADIVGLSSGTVSIWLQSPDIQIVIRELQKRELGLVRADLNALRHKAVETMEDLLSSPMDNVRFSAAKDILDRGGLGAAREVNVTRTVTNLEQQLSDLGDFSFNKEDVIDVDISDIVEEIKNGVD